MNTQELENVGMFQNSKRMMVSWWRNVLDDQLRGEKNNQPLYLGGRNYSKTDLTLALREFISVLIVLYIESGKHDSPLMYTRIGIHEV
jgi:hypothetical protein